MTDYIDRQALCDDLREYKVHPIPVSSDESEVKGYNDGIDLAISVIAEFPSAEPERTANVEKVDTNSPHSQVYKCGKCGQYTHRTAWSRDVVYCPSCGARLEWE